MSISTNIVVYYIELDTNKNWTKMQNVLEHSIRKSFNACQSAIMFWKSDMEDI